MGKYLIAAGVLLVVVGIAFELIEASTGARGLPGDITYRRGNFVFHFPVANSIVASIVLSLVLYLMFGFRR